MVLLSLLYSKKQSIFFEVHNIDFPSEKIKKVNYELKDHNGNLIPGMKGKIKKRFLKRQFKIKYDFSSTEDPETSITNGWYTLVINYEYNGIKYQNVLELRKAWYADPDFFEYGSISGNIEQERETSNKARGITILESKYPYKYKIPLKMKSSVIEGKVLDDDGNRLGGAVVELNKQLRLYVSSNQEWLTETNKRGEFEIEVDLMRDAPKELEAALIISKRNHHPEYYPISYITLKNRDSIEIKRIPVSKKKEKINEIYCETPRIWNDTCSECVCSNDNETWYYELEACDVRDCKDSKQQIIIKNNKIVCEDAPTNEGDYYDDDDLDFDDRSECFIDFQLLKTSYNKCKKNKRGFKQVKNILKNYNCSFDLDDYMNNIYLVNALYSDVMSLNDDDFECLFSNDNECNPSHPINDINKFEYLDIIFSHMNNIVEQQNSMNSIKIDTNVEAYKANIYLKQVQFYYKYCELLYSLRDLKWADRKPRKYIFDIDSEDFDDRFEIQSKNDLTDLQNDIFKKLEQSLSAYYGASSSAKNWGAYASTVISQLEKDKEWIPFVW